MKLKLIITENFSTQAKLKPTEMNLRLGESNSNIGFFKRTNAVIFNKFTLDIQEEREKRYYELRKTNDSFFRRMNFEFNQI